MRKIPALVTVLGLASLTLVGCASVGAPGCSLPAQAGSDLQSQVTVSGAPGSDPSVSIGAPLHVEKGHTWELAAGSGTPLTGDDQLFSLDFFVYDGTTGERTYASQGDASTTITLGQWLQVFPGSEGLLTCATPGSRVVLTLPPEGIEPQAGATLGLGSGDSAVVVVDVAAAYLTRATGALVFNDAHGMPTVVRAPDGQPGIIVPDAAPPADIRVQTLVRGDGEVLEDDDTALVNYTGVPWESRAKVFDTTWGASPAGVTVANAQLPGFTEALKGQTVGSQVLVVVPADQVPAEGAGSAPAGKTLVYVIDVLGVAPEAATTR